MEQGFTRMVRLNIHNWKNSNIQNDCRVWVMMGWLKKLCKELENQPSQQFREDNMAICHSCTNWEGECITEKPCDLNYSAYAPRTAEFENQPAIEKLLGEIKTAAGKSQKDVFYYLKVEAALALLHKKGGENDG